MSINIEGFDKAITFLKSFEPNINAAIPMGLSASAQRVKERLNARMAQYNQTFQVYKLSDREFVVGPTITEIEKVVDIPDWKKFKGMQRCVWLHYKRYVTPENRIDISRYIGKEELLKIVNSLLPEIKNIMIYTLKRYLGVT